MTRDEANGQVTAFFHRLGLGTSPPLPVTALVGEAPLQFDYVDADQALSVRALVYRFRAPPRPGVVEAALAAAKTADTGGGQLVLEKGRALLVRRDFTERTPDRRFAGHVDALGRASLLWAHDLFAGAVEDARRS